MESALKQGVKEIWLTSQDNGAYGKDIGSSLPALLDELLKIKPIGVKPDDAGEMSYMIRIGMINPNHALEFVDELVRILNHPNVFKFVHIPLQSGSNRILKLMNRKYSEEEFIFLVERLRRVPGLTIATDIIAGFPGETDSEFEETYKLIERLQIPVLNITKFCPRPGTPAKKLKVLPNKISKDRTLALANLHKKMRLNLRWIGWEGDVLVDEIGKRNSFVGRNQFYKPIVLKNPGLKLGMIVRARVVKAEEHHLEAELI
jgi:threonylcarbamoyladenosine tRNA methylthiotransferase CDKAL1